MPGPVSAARSHEARGRPPRRRGAGAARSSAAGCRRRAAARRASAAAGRSGSASSITWLETSSVTPPAASPWNSSHRSRRSTGSRPTVGSSSTSTSGAPSSAAASETRAALPAGEPADERLGVVRRARPRRSRRRRRRRGAPSTRGEVREVLAHREVGVHATAPGSRSRPRGAARASRPAGPSTSNVAASTTCTPTIAAHERRLAAAARAEQAGDASARDLEVTPSSTTRPPRTTAARPPRSPAA